MKLGFWFALAATTVLSHSASAQSAPTAFNACKACHKVEAGKNGVGPSLFGVFGKKAGFADGFKYSDAQKKLWRDLG